MLFPHLCWRWPRAGPRRSHHQILSRPACRPRSAVVSRAWAAARFLSISLDLSEIARGAGWYGRRGPLRERKLPAPFAAASPAPRDRCGSRSSRIRGCPGSHGQNAAAARYSPATVRGPGHGSKTYMLSGRERACVEHLSPLVFPLCFFLVPPQRR